MITADIKEILKATGTSQDMVTEMFEKTQKYPQIRELLYSVALDDGELKKEITSNGMEKEYNALGTLSKPEAKTGKLAWPIPTKEQYSAISNIQDGETRVIVAVPGSGKTFCLVLAIENLLSNKRVNPNEVTMLSFTTAAAKEMKDRVKLRNPEQNWNAISVSTAHSLAYRILRKYVPRMKIDLLKEEEQKNLVVNEVLPFVSYKSVDKDGADGSFRSSQVESNLFKAIQVARLAPGDTKERSIIASRFALKIEELNDALKFYELAKTKHRKMDYEDILYKAIALLNNNSKIRSEVQAHAKVLIVDEYQDTSLLQRKFEDAIRPEGGIKMIVGDDDQAIFTSLGANVNLMINDSNNPKYSLKVLNESRRQTKSLAEFGNAVSYTIDGRIPKKYEPMKSALEGDKPTIAQFDNRNDEIKFILTSVRERIISGENPASIAILCRLNSQVKEVLNAIRQDSVLKGSLATYSVAKSNSLVDNINAEEYKTIISSLANSKSPTAFNDLLNLEFGSLYKVSLDSQNPIKEFESIIKSKGYKQTKEEIFIKGYLQALEKGTAHEAFSTFLKATELGYRPLDDVEAENNYYQELESLNIPREEAENAIFEAVADVLEQRSRTVVDKPGLVVSTIHKAKGLEYDSVYIPFMSKDEFEKNPATDNKDLKIKQKNESRRIAYVAVTRAKKNEIISYSGKVPASVLSLLPTETYQKLENGHSIAQEEQETSKKRVRHHIIHSTEIENKNEKLSSVVKEL